MSMSQIAVLMRDQRDMLKTFLPAFKIARSGTAQKKLRITVLESCLPWLFASPRLTAIPVKMAGKKWATPEQEEFLLSFMSEFHESAATKNYDDFFTRIWALWFEGDDYVRIPDDIKALARAVEMRQQQLVTWYRWQINPAHHARSKGARGMLKFDTVLGGGMELKGTRAPQKIDIYLHKFYEAKVKNVADNAITTENITNRGPKLNKHREITRQMYLEESESVKADIDRKYRKVKANFAKKRQQQTTPEVHPRRGARRRRVDRSPAPTSSMDPPTLPVHMEMNAPHLRVHNNVPFNPRERDNNIGVPARRARPADSRKKAQHS
ncbi:hypothetical protein BDR07DRAFT_1485383 [Suillus spraguei]|nr:hypothetical protein BDR07DRAFT_1485383 [Suillus spraguei]